MPDGTTREGVNKEVSVAIYNYQNGQSAFKIQPGCVGEF